ncbi:HET-domain-containing protein [Karstenula rhodostoma CBS 690.94]|uniref:HET-domain-containing protein n=1 Tax=Karstenula rhodostoma CBS 690.94 TaxID=1392251 RepID=A0A9P4PX22_9PLEO|nr:HET-domain-containing protein [Karstenula rhodostoma CBS 690.94]
MGKAQGSNRKRTKLTLGTFLQLKSVPANVVAPRSRAPLPAPTEDLRPLLKTFSGGYIASPADYTRDWPTPAEVRARHFKGLCLECQLIFATWGPPNDGLGIRYRGSKNAHHSFKDLERCWCPLCKMLLREFRHYDEESMELVQSREHRATRSHVRVYKHVRHVPCHYVELEFVAGDRVLKPSFRMLIAGRESQPRAGTIHSSTDCDSVWELANKWLRTCRDMHGYCEETYLDKVLPTRLLRVGADNSELRLALSSSLPQSTEYATLSHRWGSKPFLKLTRANIDAFLDNVRFESLSKTFRDAITAARNLGFKHLWIDSLCIVQDDDGDWQHESVKMSHVYSNSSLNLAASDSPDGETGLFFENRPDVPNVWKVSFPPTGTTPSNTMYWERDEKELNKMYVWNCITSGSRAIIEDNALTERAWTLQERLLPPRTLHFGREQIAWECRFCNAYEALPDMFEEGIMGLSPENFAVALEDGDSLEETDNFKLWSDLVEDYSKRSMTYGRDKLVAISGLARILAPVFGMEYVAGLWVKDLIRSLVWHKRIMEPSLGTAPAAYRAPSWSWASVDGQVRFPMGFIERVEGKNAVDADYPATQPAKVLEAVATYPEDQFGEVTSGFICVRAQALFRVTIDTAKWLNERQFPVHIRGLGLIKEFIAYPDFDKEALEGESLLIPLASGIQDYPNDYPELRGLFLEHVEDRVYRRKGTWRIGGQYSDQGFDEINKVDWLWQAEKADRLSIRSECGLDEGKYACLWDGEAYNVTII